jgi:hypothetical protein
MNLQVHTTVNFNDGSVLRIANSLIIPTPIVTACVHCEFAGAHHCELQ